MKEILLISACLCGENTKYNGGNNKIDRLEELMEKYELIKVCPEVLGGLPTPRVPSEIIDDNLVFNKNGEEVSKNYYEGAMKVLKMVDTLSISKALFKESSPSCGVHTIYDGTFSHTKISGMGMTTRLLHAYGVKIYSENEIDELLK